MARPLRIEREGGWYHVTARGNERQKIYRDDRDRRHFLELLAELVDRFGLRLHVYVLMANHYHLLVELRETNLSQAMQWLNVSYSAWFNRKHDRSGHLFQGRFKSIVVSRDEWALALSRYVHLNPVRLVALGLSKERRRQSRQGIKGAPEPEQVRQRLSVLKRYQWSSYRAYIGLERAPEWLEGDDVLSLGGGPKSRRRENYRQSVEAEVREGLKQRPWESVLGQLALGSREFLKKLQDKLGPKERERGRLSNAALKRPSWEAVVVAVEKVQEEQWEVFRERYGDIGREMALYLGRTEGGLGLRQLAELTKMKSEAAVAVSLRRFRARLAEHAATGKKLKQASELLNVRS